MTKKIKLIIGLTVSSLGLMFAFQNCTKTAFSTNAAGLNSGVLNGSSLSSNVDTGTIDRGNGTSTGGTTTGGGTGTVGSGATRSDTCDDFAALGWTSKSECLHDGGWHLVYQSPSVSNPSQIGNTDIIESHMLAGGDLKVIVPIQNLRANGVNLPVTVNGNEDCQQVYRSQSGTRPVYCLTTTRFSGESDSETAQGSARYGTDGSIYCNSVKNPGKNGCTVDAVSLKWYVRY